VLTKLQKSLVTDQLRYVQNMTQIFCVGPFDVVGPRTLSTTPMPQSGPAHHGKSQIVYLDMHHLFLGINYQIHFVSLASLVSIHLLIYLSTHPSHHPHSQHPSLFTLSHYGHNLTFSTNSSHFNRLLLSTRLPLYGN